ncbi:MAG: HNH endonuclease [Deltaproteobacteria bacterium]|nr:MAG: HNH endonuclease [Deltaproteobacteria bacterium]
MDTHIEARRLRFLRKYDGDPMIPGGCWLWTGATNKVTRYGQWSWREGKRVVNRLAHRYAYEVLVGPIPEGLVIDHSCNVRQCGNPDHLEPVTQKVNVRRGKKGTMTHCKRGHPLAGVNLYLYRGRRYCRECGRLHGRRAQERKRSREV